MFYIILSYVGLAIIIFVQASSIRSKEQVIETLEKIIDDRKLLKEHTENMIDLDLLEVAGVEYQQGFPPRKLYKLTEKGLSFPKSIEKG